MNYCNKSKLTLLLLLLAIPFYSCSRNKTDDVNNNSNSVLLNNKSFKGFFFISESRNDYKLFFYNFIEDTVITIFDKPNQKVIEVEQNHLNNSAFFITVSGLNKKIEIPEYENIRLYLYNKTSNNIELINQFSPSIHVYSFWVDLNRFKFIRVYFDDIVASYVVKHSIVYNQFGKLLSEENEVFDIIKSGYPVKELPKLKLLSNDKKIQIKFATDSLIIFNTKSKRIEKIFYDKNLLDAVWTEDDKHLILFLQNKADKFKEIILYDLANHKVVKTFNNVGIKNFLLNEKYLIFDYFENGRQLIELFHIDKLLVVSKISVGENSFLKNALFK
jgi:hypothetical protein